MLTGYTLTDGLLSPAASWATAQWIDINPTAPETLRSCHEALGIPLSFLQAANDPHEHSHWRQEGEHTLIVVRVSYPRDPKRHTPFGTLPLAIILTPTQIITVSSKKQLITPLIHNTPVPLSLWCPILFFLTLLLRISKNFIEHVHQIDASTGTMEDSLQKSMQNKELVDLMHAEKALIYLLTSLKINQNLLEAMQQQSFLALNAQQGLLMRNILLENTQAIGMAEVFSQVLGNLGDTFGAIISNNLNQAMKFLTGMTIVLMIPTILVGAYGMNVPLPFASHPQAFAALAGLCLILSAAVWYSFWKKNWM